MFCTLIFDILVDIAKAIVMHCLSRTTYKLVLFHIRVVFELLPNPTLISFWPLFTIYFRQICKKDFHALLKEASEHCFFVALFASLTHLIPTLSSFSPSLFLFYETSKSEALTSKFSTNNKLVLLSRISPVLELSRTNSYKTILF